MQVDIERKCGNYEGARRASYMALGWGIAGIVAGVIILLTIVVVFIVVIIPQPDADPTESPQ